MGPLLSRRGEAGDAPHGAEAAHGPAGAPLRLAGETKTTSQGLILRMSNTTACGPFFGALRHELALMRDAAHEMRDALDAYDAALDAAERDSIDVEHASFDHAVSIASDVTAVRRVA